MTFKVCIGCIGNFKTRVLRHNSNSYNKKKQTLLSTLSYKLESYMYLVKINDNNNDNDKTQIKLKI